MAKKDHVLEPIFPPKFAPGDMVKVTETNWPPGSNMITYKTALYVRPGCPQTSGKFDELPPHRKDVILNTKLIGITNAGDLCLVIAVSFFPNDGKWYYLLNNMKPKGMGWTRCCFRLKKVDEAEDVSI